MRKVCKKCNETWLSDIQQSAKIVLKALALSKFTSPTFSFQHVVDVSPPALGALAAWVTNIAIMGEMLNSGSRAITRAEIDHFYANHMPPEWWQLYIGWRQEGRFGYQHHSMDARELGTEPQVALPEDSPGRANIQLTAFTVGPLVFAAVSSPNPALVSPFDSSTSTLSQLWPRSEALRWPIGFPATDAYLERLFSEFGRGMPLP